MEEIKLITKQRIVQVTNSFNEKYDDFIIEKEFVFERGKIYGIIGEYGEGGEMVSALISGRVPIKEEEFYCDDIKVDYAKIQDISWYVGKSEYTKGLITREISVRKALINAVKKYQRYSSIDEIIEDFHLRLDRIDYGLSKYSGEKWRASLAIGYACRKEVYCFSWLNTACFSSILLSSGVFRFFKRLKEEGCIIILPTSRKENVAGLVDEVIEIDNPRFKQVISESEYFKQYF